MDTAKERRDYIKAILKEFPNSSKNKDKKVLKIQEKIKKYEYKIMKNGFRTSGKRFFDKDGSVQAQTMEKDIKRDKKRNKEDG